MALTKQDLSLTRIGRTSGPTGLARDQHINKELDEDIQMSVIDFAKHYVIKI
jgi:hypothetical protein